MSKPNEPVQPSAAPDQPERPPTKKEQVLSLFSSGITDVADLALLVQARPSYVATVLQEARQLPGYFDLYTSTAQPMNFYSKFFANRLGFRDEETARASVELIDRYYRQFEMAADRAGQHHALVMALTMFDRARWTNKAAEADVFRRWLLERLQETDAVKPERRQAVEAPARPRRPKTT
jgi:hypothetical protein